MTLNNKDLRKMLDTAVTAGRLAGQRAMQEIHNITVSVKSPDQLVTQADTICQKIIIDHINQAFTGHGFIAEEGESGNSLKVPPTGEGNIFWVIDPIDGTNNFAKGMLLFTVSIAAFCDGKPVVGVIFDPATDSMFTAVSGCNSELNGQPIHVNDDDINNFSNIGTDSHFDGPVPGWVTNLMSRTRFRNLGSTCLQMAYTASGGLIADICPCPKLWDMAAGAIICKNAGAIVTDWDGNDLFPMGLNNYQGGPVPTLVANKRVHPEILQILK